MLLIPGASIGVGHGESYLPWGAWNPGLVLAGQFDDELGDWHRRQRLDPQAAPRGQFRRDAGDGDFVRRSGAGWDPQHVGQAGDAVLSEHLHADLPDPRHQFAAVVTDIETLRGSPSSPSNTTPSNRGACLT